MVSISSGFIPGTAGIGEEIRRRHGIGDEFVLLFVSNNFRMRGLRHLLEALQDIKRETFPPFRLHRSGQGSKRALPPIGQTLRPFQGGRLCGGNGGTGEILWSGRPFHPSFFLRCVFTCLVGSSRERLASHHDRLDRGEWNSES